mmetsp:Transcript_49305/g.123261  ORF Transcript_49305/g.123261 Transcript_49305/m.123261 type:complete len:234 (+) Transcript_49305:851-1552(+)
MHPPPQRLFSMAGAVQRRTRRGNAEPRGRDEAAGGRSEGALEREGRDCGRAGGSRSDGALRMPGVEPNSRRDALPRRARGEKVLLLLHGEQGGCCCAGLGGPNIILWRSRACCRRGTLAKEHPEEATTLPGLLGSLPAIPRSPIPLVWRRLLASSPPRTSTSRHHNPRLFGPLGLSQTVPHRHAQQLRRLGPTPQDAAGRRRKRAALVVSGGSIGREEGGGLPCCPSGHRGGG